MRKLKGKINGRLITREFFPEYVGKEGDINCGDCYRWAYIAYKLYSNVSLYSNEVHAFPCQKDLYFDSESPDGVEEIHQLECNLMWDYDESNSYIQVLEDFVDYWQENGNFHDQLEVDKQIAEYWKRYDLRKSNRRMNAAA